MDRSLADRLIALAFPTEPTFRGCCSLKKKRSTLRHADETTMRRELQRLERAGEHGKAQKLRTELLLHAL